MLCMYSDEIKFQGVMLEYATVFLSCNPTTFAYIPVYLLFTAGLIALIIWQHASFMSFFGTKENPTSSGVWGILNLIEFVWGLQFLRDSCNFFLIYS